MNKFFYIAVILVLMIAISGCTQIPKKSDNISVNSSLYDAVDRSVNNFLFQASHNQTQKLYDAVDVSVEQFLNK